MLKSIGSARAPQGFAARISEPRGKSPASQLRSGIPGGEGAYQRCYNAVLDARIH